jgi:NADPH2:quinone reductase
MQTIELEAPGGAEALRLEERPERSPGPSEARVRIEAAGVNFIDVYHRTGLYPLPRPFRLGVEGAGVVEALGEGVTGLALGDRVAFVLVQGAYATSIVVPAHKLVPIPDGVTTRQAAAAMVQGMTAHYLTHATFPLAAGDTCIVHAAAGGVGLLLCQLAKARGANVLATVSTEAKAERARAAGADHVVLYTREDFAAEAMRLTAGRGVDVVYDSVGQATFQKSLAALRPRGMLVSFGQASGPVPPFDVLALSAGSLFLTRASLAHYVATRDELLERAGAVLSAVADGSLRLTIDRELPLEEAREAHRLLEGRSTIGKLLLIPTA